MIDTVVGSYRILSELSVGGMGTVYRAEHTLIGRPAAVKVLRPELSSNRDIVDRFFNEAKVTTSIKHPGIVEVFDFGYMPSGHAYLTMEFLEGMTLAQQCEAHGKFDEAEAAMLLRGVCSALTAAHAKGIVHRDLKPDNIFMVPDPDFATGERPKLLDFGIAKLTDAANARGKTQTGAFMGTPTYMSPEQCRGAGEVDQRSDLYSLGCIFYELVTGQPPFTGDGAGELIGAHLHLTPTPPSQLNPQISETTDRLILSLLSKKPAERPQTARELSQQLAAIAQTKGWLSPTHSGPTIERPVTTPTAGLPVTPTPSGVPAGSPSAPAAPPATTPRSPTGTRLGTTSKTMSTLTGAASESLDAVSPPSSKRKLGIVFAAVGALADGGIAIAVVSSGKSTPQAASPSSPAITEPATPSAPSVAPVAASPPTEPAKPPGESAAAS
ncbi:MAG: serine/threonine protein kinase, partial [Kofleriaceae bacterium]